MNTALFFSLIANITLALAYSLQRIRLRAAQSNADMYRDMFFSALDHMRDYARNSIQRDPRTGRYLKKGH